MSPRHSNLTAPWSRRSQRRSIAPGANAALDPPQGLVFAGVDLERAARDLDGLNLGTSGYGFVITREGHFVRHPRRDLVGGLQTIFDTAVAARDTAMHSVAVHATRGESGTVVSVDEMTGQATWIVYQAIPSSGWTLVVVLFQEEFLPKGGEMRHAWFQITATALGGLLLLSLAAGPAVMTPRTTGPAWTLAIVTAAAVASAIASLWLVFDRYPAGEGTGVAVHGAAPQDPDRCLCPVDRVRRRRQRDREW